MKEIDLKDLLERLSSELNCKIHFRYDNEGEITNFYFESDLFEMTFWIEDSLFTIGNIEVFDEGNGHGTKIVEIVLEFCEDSNLECVKANKVKKNRFSFWEELGFNCDEQDCYYDL